MKTAIHAPLKTGLSKNERKVLYYIVRYPMLFDTEICSLMPMKLSTFCNIKKRLRDMGCYKVMNVPVFERIGCELLVVSYGFMERTSSIEDRMKMARKMLDECAEIFYIVSESNQGINISVARNYTDYDKDVQNFNWLYMKHGFLKPQGFVHMFFPFKTSYIYNLFNYSAAIDRFFGLGMGDDLSFSDESDFTAQQPMRSEVNLTRTEKLVYCGLIEYPEVPDTVLSKVLSVSKNTIAKAKKKFFDDALLVRRIVPNLGVLGFELLALTRITFNPNATRQQIGDGIGMLNSILAPVLLASKSLEGIGLTPYRDFEDFQTRYSRALNVLSKRRLVVDEPVNYLLSIPHMTTVKNHVYAPLAKKLMDIQ